MASLVMTSSSLLLWHADRCLDGGAAAPGARDIVASGSERAGQPSTAIQPRKRTAPELCVLSGRTMVLCMTSPSPTVRLIIAARKLRADDTAAIDPDSAWSVRKGDADELATDGRPHHGRSKILRCTRTCRRSA